MNINFLLDKIIHILLVSIICIMLIIGFLFLTPVSVHADSGFSLLPNSPFTSFSDELPWIQSSNIKTGFFSNSDTSIYAFAAPYSQYSSSLTIFFISSGPVYPNSSSSYYVKGIQSSSSSFSYPTAYTSVSYPYNLSYGGTTSDSSGTSVPVYSSLDEAVSSFSSFLDSNSVSYEGFRLPPGYLAAIQGSSVSFDLYTDMPEYSSIKQWAYSTQRYGLESSLPSQASFDYDYGTRIIWHITGDTNLLGEGYHAASSLSASVGSGYLLLVNPAYYGSTANIMNADMFNGVVTLSNVQGISSIRLYSLGSFIGSGGITSDYSTNSAINNASVVVTNGGFYIENSDGTLTPVSDLPSFGDTSTDGSSSGLIAKFRAILEGFVEKIESLLIAPVEYINRLIVAASNFFAWLSGLWSWLPPAVSGVLTSVLYIMAIVGALKLLWR